MDKLFQANDGIDRAATAGYQAGLIGDGDVRRTGDDIEDLSFNIGFRKGQEDRARAAKNGKNNSDNDRTGQAKPKI